MKFPHGLRITRPGAGGSRNGAGKWENAADFVLYDDRADVQDRGRSGRRAPDGTETMSSDAVAYVRVEAGLGSIRKDDAATVTWEDGTARGATVHEVRRLDGVLGLRWLQAG